MQLTKLGHSCFRVTTGPTTMVLDPGSFSDPAALDGADAVLITHEHADHVVPEQLAAAAAARPGLRVWTNEAVAGRLTDFEELRGRVHVVAHGDTFTVGPNGGGPGAGSIDVHVYGEKHARIHPDIPLIGNVGFLLPHRVFHPGDALIVPEEQVDTLLAPAAAPWLKVSELVDWLRAVGPEQAYLMHDALLSDVGRGVTERIAGGLSPAAVEQWADGESREL